MSNEIDWQKQFELRYSTSSTPDWWANKELRSISVNGLGFLAIDPKDNSLHWDGQELVTVKRLDEPERIMAGIVAGSSAILASIELFKFLASFA